MDYHIGDKVRITLPQGRWHGARQGTITSIYRMTPARGPDRTKYAITCPHSRTKSRTITYAMELGEFTHQATL